MTTEELKQFISTNSPEAVFEETQFLNVIIESSKLRDLALQLRENSEAEFDYLFCLSGVDWKDFFYVVYHLASRKYKHTIVLKAKISDTTINCPLVCRVSTILAKKGVNARPMKIEPTKKALAVMIR